MFCVDYDGGMVGSVVSVYAMAMQGDYGY